MIGFFRRLFAREPALGVATMADARAIARLHAESFRRGWGENEVEQLLLDRSVLSHRAATGRTFAGFIISRMAADEAEILSVAIRRSQRSRGIAAQLLRMHLGRLAALGIRTVFLEVDPDNQPALRLYRRAGFQEVGTRPNYYPKGGAMAAALVLRRDLS